MRPVSNKVIILLIYYSLFILLNSCGKVDKETSIYYNEFEKESFITGEYVGPVKYFLKPTQLTVSDSLLIVLDYKTDYFLHFLNMNSGLQPACAFGVIGKGPNEYIFPEISERVIEEKIFITDKSKFYSGELLIDSIFKNNRVAVNYNDKYFYPPELTIPFELFKNTDTSIVGSTSSGISTIFSFNPQNNNFNLAKNELDFPGYNQISKLDLGQVLYCVNDYNHSKRKIVSAMRFFDRIDVFDNNLDVELSIRAEIKSNHDYSYNKNLPWINENTWFFYVDVFTTNNYIYGLYCGKDLESAIPNVGQEIRVFSWNGKAICRMLYDANLSRIYIPEGDSIIFGIDEYNLNQPLVKFDISELTL